MAGLADLITYRRLWHGSCGIPEMWITDVSVIFERWILKNLSFWLASQQEERTLQEFVTALAFNPKKVCSEASLAPLLAVNLSCFG
jgi:hypothetical protein